MMYMIIAVLFAAAGRILGSRDDLQLTKSQHGHGQRVDDGHDGGLGRREDAKEDAPHNDPGHNQGQHPGPERGQKFPELKGRRVPHAYFRAL